jgi:hypothetical protein
MKRIVFAMLLIGVLLLAGCAQNDGQRSSDTYAPYQNSVGGGCGVAAPAEPVEAITSIAEVPAA